MGTYVLPLFQNMLRIAFLENSNFINFDHVYSKKYQYPQYQLYIIWKYICDGSNNKDCKSWWILLNTWSNLAKFDFNQKL
jgi:hypothetical protein